MKQVITAALFLLSFACGQAPKRKVVLPAPYASVAGMTLHSEEAIENHAPDAASVAWALVYLDSKLVDYFNEALGSWKQGQLFQIISKYKLFWKEKNWKIPYWGLVSGEIVEDELILVELKKGRCFTDTAFFHELGHLIIEVARADEYPLERDLYHRYEEFWTLTDTWGKYASVLCK